MLIECLDNPHDQKIDVIITTVPWTDSYIPLMAPAVLKPIVERAGMTCLAVDLNAEIYKKILPLHHRDKVYEFFFDGRTDCSQSVLWLENMMHSVAMQLIKWKPKFIGLSLFSYVSRSSAEWLCYFIKKLDPNVKILLGGAGCLEQFTGPGHFADDLIKRKLADFHIRGDGEHALFELLIGNQEYVGINSLTWKELDRSALAKLPMPDYRNYNFSIYNKKVLPIQGSRGCVRRCTFCDYIENWKNFQWRDADEVFKEMMTQYRNYNIRTFKFQDTLVNGNVTLHLLFLGGYVNETQQHIEFAKRWFEQHVYVKDNLLLNFGGGLGIFPNTHLDRNKNDLGVQMIGDKPHLWINQHTGNTPKQRAEWVQELNQHCKDLGYNVAINVDNHFLLEQVLKDD